MKARWYRPRDADPHEYWQWWPPGWVSPHTGFQEGQPCSSLGERDHFTSYFQICSLNEHYKFRLQRVTGDKQYMHTFSEDDGLALTFDNNSTIQIKYCDLRAILNGIAYGIAIFDADQDAWDKNPCYYGPQNFQRMTMIRKLIDLVSKTGHDHYPVGCWSLT